MDNHDHAQSLSPAPIPFVPKSEHSTFSSHTFNPPLLVDIPIPSVIMTDTVHIVYVHGFQGDHTTFQSFPSDLHNFLQSWAPQVQTWIYPTYKSTKPLSFAVKNLLRWLQGLPEGKVILAGHSMGGLLVAEAAIDPNPVARRIMGVLAFDSPYLGMHPHVVISGIASLLPKGEQGEKGPPSQVAQNMPDEGAMNNKANFVPHQEAFQIESPSDSPRSHSPPRNSLSPSQKPASSSQVSVLSGSSAPSQGGESIVSKTRAWITKYSNDPLVKWLQKHSDAPVTAVSRWVIDRFEFGFAMFDYGGLWERYRKLEQWDGNWVNFWTETAIEDMPTPYDPTHISPHPHSEGHLVGSSSPNHTPTAEEAWLTGSRPRTPIGIRPGAISPGARIENEFESAMKQATDKEAKKRAKEEAKQQAKEEKARLKREQKEAKEAKKREAAGFTLTSPPPEVVIEPAHHTPSSPTSSPSSPSLSDAGSSVGGGDAKHKDKHKDKTKGGEEESRVPRHFITLPPSLATTTRDRWLKVKIAGAADEVEAHCGMFMRKQNLHYDEFVQRVAAIVIGWVYQ